MYILYIVLCPMAHRLYLPYVEMSILYAYVCVCLYVYCLLSTIQYDNTAGSDSDCSTSSNQNFASEGVSAFVAVP